MRRLIVVIGCVIGSAAMANVGVFSGSGQTPVVEKTDAVQMVEEVVVMTPRAADGPVGTNCSNQDPMDYHCTFRLRNLTDKAVKIQAGFPLDAQFLRYGEKQTTEELVKRFDFSVEVRGQATEVRYVPFDRDQKFSQIFLWPIEFAPKEELKLVVKYRMRGYLGLMDTFAKEKRLDEKDFRHGFGILSTGVGEGHFYVTGTGSCWAGVIEKAVFKYYSQEFEAHLRKRGAYDESVNERKERLASLDKKGRRLRGLMRPDSRLVRNWSPAPEEWKKVEDGAGRFHYEWVKTPFKPELKGGISLAYVAPPIPVEPSDVDLLERGLKESGKFDAEVCRDLKDIALEFYGVNTGNKRIGEFLQAQCWFGRETGAVLSPELKSRLEQEAVMTDEDRALIAAETAAAEQEKQAARQAEECRRNLRQLQACGEQFKMMGYGLPSDLNQFVEKEFLKSLPKCPNGGRYAVSEDDKGVVRAACSSGLKGHATYK